jgi:hypothetical protein
MGCEECTEFRACPVARLYFQRERRIPDYRAAGGNCGLHILPDAKGKFVTVLLLSFCESRAALEAFNDPQSNPEISCEERKLLLESESAATTYEVV